MEWKSMFPASSFLHLQRIASGHRPLLLRLLGGDFNEYRFGLRKSGGRMLDCGRS